MFKAQSPAREQALITARQYFHYAADHLLFAKWRQKAIQDFAFYDGEGQYPPEVLRQLKDRDQDPIVVNKIKSMINQSSGVEMMERTRIGFRSHSGADKKELLSKSVTHLGYEIQEANDISQKRSQIYRDSKICGVGFSNIFKQARKIYYEYVHPLNILYDADDFSPFMTDQQYVIRMHWVAKEEAKLTWPKYSKEIDDLFVSAEPANAGSFTSEFFSRISAYVDIYAIGGGGIGSRILVIEVQRKEKRKFLCGLDYQGNYFETFNEKEAIELAGSEKNLEEEIGYQIVRTVFCRDIVFDHAPLNPNLPNMPDFTYIPCVFGRRSADAIPDGWMSPMKDLQRILNYNKLKEVAMLNSTRAVVDAEAFVGQTVEEMRSELSRADSLLIKSKDSNISLHPNVDLAHHQIEASRRLDEEFQQVSGMFSDAMGAPTNATSGIAINSRAKLSMTNQRVGLDHLELMKKREGRMMLNLIQGGYDENIIAQILTPDEEQTVMLNMVRQVNGKKVVFNDIRTLPLDVYVEQTHDYESAPEEQRATLEALLSNQNAQMILQSPGFLKLLGIREWQKISEEMQRVSQQQMQMEQMSQSGAPIPQQQPIDQSVFAGLSQ